tara:strand:- start:3621 stop:4403 length:783 start_codon:yes stop_codon:yes gene_type:complete
MNLLQGDRMEELASFLDGNNNNQVGEAAVEQTEPNEPVEAVQETVEAQQDVQVEASSPSEAEHQVPYGRFKEVINARNDLRNRNDDLERQLQELQTQQQNVPTEQSTSQYQGEFDNLYGQLDEQPYDDEYSKRFQSMESRIEEFEVFQEQQKLETELSFAADRYPGVPREALLTAVINNPNTDVLDIAERYNTFVSGIRESAIAEYAKTNGVQQQELPPAVPPRVTPGPSGQVATGYGDQPKPRNLNEAKDALFKFLQNR